MDLIVLAILISIFVPSSRADVNDVSAKIKKMIDIDQRDLSRYSDTIVENSKSLKKLMAEVGWPGIRTYGKEVEGNALVICLHAENDRELQLKCLDLVKSAVPSGDAAPSDIAYLTDKLAVNAGEKQTFGTQGYADEYGCWQPKALLDPKGVDSLRAKYVMPSLESYRKKMNSNPYLRCNSH